MEAESANTMRMFRTTARAALAMLAEAGDLLVSDMLIVLTPMQFLMQLHELERSAAATLELDENAVTLPPNTPCGRLLIAGTPRYIPKPGASVDLTRFPGVSQNPDDWHLVLDDRLTQVFEITTAEDAEGR